MDAAAERNRQRTALPGGGARGASGLTVGKGTIPKDSVRSLEIGHAFGKLLGDVVALSKPYAAARSMRSWVSTRIRISFFWLTQIRARSAEPKSRLVRENPLSTCHLWP